MVAVSFTEAEARKRWCPFAHTADGDDRGAASFNRVGDGKPAPDCMCLGSACMAWVVVEHSIERMVYDPASPNKASRDTSNDFGRCGLVAEPR